MSAQYFIGSSSPAIAYSPRYAPGYSALSGLKIRGCAQLPTERYANNKMLFATHKPSRWDELYLKLAALVYDSSQRDESSVEKNVHFFRSVGTFGDPGFISS